MRTESGLESHRGESHKFFRMVVARDGVEPPVGIEPSEVADSTRDIRGRSDYLDIFPARIQYTDSMKF